MPLLLGGIAMWSGLLENVPNGWQLCDGTNGTPDLRNRFVIGAGNTYSVGSIGGNTDTVLVEHTHTGSTSTDGAHTHTIAVREFGSVSIPLAQTPNGSITSTSAGAHTHSATIQPAGEDPTNKNLPPYYALAFIMQLS